MSEQRYTASTITDDELDRLYARLAAAERERDVLAAACRRYDNGTAVHQGACSVCGHTYQVRKDGTVRHHVRDQPGGQWSRGTCPGSRKPPKETGK